MTKSKTILTFLFAALLVLTMPVFSSDNIDPNIPESWYQAPKTASEVGIEEFNQSPMLDDEVANGELPPVEDRLPADPAVIEPYDEVGKYGGTAVLWATPSEFDDPWRGGYEMVIMNFMPSAGVATPDGAKVVPFYLKNWEYKNDYKELILHLREDMKWSDGEPFTAEEFTFWWKNVRGNENLNSVRQPLPSNPVEIKKIDKYTVSITMENSYPRFHDFLGHDRMFYMGPASNPVHYMKQIHKDFTDEEKVEEIVKNSGMESWSEFYMQVERLSPFRPSFEYKRPTLRAYIVTEKSETHYLLERNPYFPFVDTEGNQLPYIDKIRVNLANNAEMAVTKAVTGEATLSYNQTTAKDLPLYNKQEEKGNYETLIYGDPAISSILCNLTNQDPQLNKVFNKVEFRKALSLGIDRERISKKVFYGQAVPLQSGLVPSSSLYKEEYGKAYTDYKPEKARELLDEINVVDVNDDGWREGPEGEEFKPTVIFNNSDATGTSQLELIKNDFAKIGINVELKGLSGSLVAKRMKNNEYEMTLGGSSFFDLKFGKPWPLTKLAPFPTMLAGNPWPAYIVWHRSDGEEGIEPTAERKKLTPYADKLTKLPLDHPEFKEAADKLLKAQAENLWTIGIVGMFPAPVLKSNELHNLANKGMLTWGIRFLRPYRPSQWYLEK